MLDGEEALIAPQTLFVLGKEGYTRHRMLPVLLLTSADWHIFRRDPLRSSPATLRICGPMRSFEQARMAMNTPSHLDG